MYFSSAINNFSADLKKSFQLRNCKKTFDEALENFISFSSVGQTSFQTHANPTRTFVWSILLISILNVGTFKFDENCSISSCWLFLQVLTNYTVFINFNFFGKESTITVITNDSQ